MNTVPGVRTLRVAVADFLERSRRYAFLVTLASMLYTAYIFLPAKDAGYVTVDLDGWRGVYNSAWVGTSLAILAAVFLSLIGFYLVKNSVERDRTTGVGEILATTPLSSRSYLFGKWLSNLLVFGSMLLVLLIAAGALQWIRAEDRNIDVFALSLPVFFITFPALAVVAAAAVLFESVSWLRGTLGNVVWFVAWIAFIVNPSTVVSSSTGSSYSQWLDPSGTGFVIDSFLDAGEASIPDYDRSHFSIGINIGQGNERTFTWEGIDWNGAVALRRFHWLAAALIVVGLGLPFFDRFDPARSGRALPGRRGRRKASKHVAEPQSPATALTPPVPKTRGPLDTPLRLPAVTGVRPAFLPLVLAELRLALKGLNRWWYLAIAGLFVAGLFLPLEAARHVWPFSWILPLGAWSGMGSREAKHGTRDLFDSSPRPLFRQFPALLFAGFLVAVLTAAAPILRYTAGGNPGGLAAVLAGAAFITSFATAAGTWTGSGRLFEVVYLLLWYVGPAQGYPEFDFMGTTAEAVASGTPALFATLAMVFTLLALYGRKRRLAV